MKQTVQEASNLTASQWSIAKLRAGISHLRGALEEIGMAAVDTGQKISTLSKLLRTTQRRQYGPRRIEFQHRRR